MATTIDFTISLSSKPTQWYDRQQWRQADADDLARSQALRVGLCDLLVYPTTDITGDPTLSTQESNYRLALHSLIEEMGRNDIFALYQMARLLFLSPPDSKVFNYQQERETAFIERFFNKDVQHTPASSPAHQPDASDLTPPSRPIDREFATPDELADYLAAVEQYLTDCISRIEPDPHGLAQEIEHRIVELTALCLAVGSKKRLARKVATILLDKMGSAEIKLSNYYAGIGSDNPSAQEMAAEEGKALWDGAGVFPLSQQVDDFIDRRAELLMMTEYLMTLLENPADNAL